MNVILDFLKTFLPGFAISIVAGIISCIMGIWIFWKTRKEAIKQKLVVLINECSDARIKALEDSNSRHSKAIKDMEVRLNVLETEQANLQDHVRPELNKISTQINDIHKILIEWGRR